jgi:glycosyltransferase involved in cell wall biosynthesis
VCHCWFGWPSGLIGYRLRAQVPYLVALRGSDVPGYNPRLRMQDLVLFGPLSRRVWQHASAVVANSAGLKELAAQTWNGTIHIIPNGVDTTEFKPARRKRSGPLRLISVGRLIRRKGYDVLIEAMAGLDAELTLVGEGPEQDKLQRLAQQHKVRVRFAGAVPHSRVAQELQKADVFVLPSRAEGMSNSVLEAMACGLPVVVSDVGGAEELVNGNGSVLEKESSDKLHQILKQYVQSRPLVNMHGEKSRDLVRSLSWEATSQCYGEMYFELA